MRKATRNDAQLAGNLNISISLHSRSHNSSLILKVEWGPHFGTGFAALAAGFWALLRTPSWRLGHSSCPPLVFPHSCSLIPFSHPNTLSQHNPFTVLPQPHCRNAVKGGGKGWSSIGKTQTLCFLVPRGCSYKMVKPCTVIIFIEPGEAAMGLKISG